MQTVTRQIQWSDGNHVVEVSQGGIDYTNPDALVGKYVGEFEEFKDPREAIDTAIAIAKAWQLDCPSEVIEIGTGGTGGMTMPFSGTAVKLDMVEAFFEMLTHAPHMPTSLQPSWAWNMVHKTYPEGWNEPLFEQLQNKAQEEYEQAPKCDHCGEILGKRKVAWAEDNSWEFCDTDCLERWHEANVQIEHELVED